MEKVKERKILKGKMHGKRVFLFRHIFSFAVVMCLITCLVAVLFRTVLLKNLNEFNDLHQQNIMENAAESVFREVDHIRNVMGQASLHRELNPVRIQRGVTDLLTAQNELRRLSRADPDIEECMLISGNYGFAISDLTSYNFDWFQETFQNPLLQDCKDYTQICEVLEENPVLKIQVRGEELIALSQYHDYGDVFGKSYMVALVSGNQLLEKFCQSIPDREKMIGIVWIGDELFSTFSQDDVKQDWELLKQNSRVKQQGNCYRVLTWEYPTYELRFACLVDEEFYEAPITKTMNQSLFWLFVIFVIGIVLIVVLTYWNYKPIRKVQSTLETYLKKKPDNDQNELYFITNGIDQLIEENVRMGQRLDVGRKQLKNFCLFKLLNSPITDKNAAIRTLNEAGISMQHDCFQCISISLIYTKDLEHFTRRIEEERSSQNPYASLYYLINGTSVALIFNFDKKDSEMMRYLLDNFSDFYVREVEMVMGVGSMVEGIENLPKSYNQSQMAMRYAETGEEECLSNFDDMQLKENIEKLYNSKQVNALLNAIRRDDREAIAKELDGIKHFIRESRMPRYAIKAMYYQIVNGILSNSSNPVLFEKGNEILMAIGDALQKSSLDEVHEKIEAMCYQIVDQTSGVLLLDKILDYITQHYADVDFSIASMAEHFNMSHQSMSALFKRSMHITIIEYITKCKLSAATDLLINTNLPIAEIVKKVGYIDNSSFTRTFKSHMGSTPAEYRRSFRKQEKTE